LVIVPVNPGGSPLASATPSSPATETLGSLSSAAPAASSAASSAPAAPAQVASSGCANPCSTEGAVVCFPPNSFGLCDHGCAVVQPLAAGTSCSNGVISRRAVPCENCRFMPRNHTRHAHHRHTVATYY
jgi:hypothetical protein